MRKPERETVGATPLGHRVGPSAHVYVLAATALAAGLAEAGVLLLKRFVGGQFIWTGLDVIWMAPVSYLLFFALPAPLLLLLAKRRPEARRLAATVFLAVLVSVGALLVVVVGGGVHPLARWLVAAGLAVQAARLARLRPGSVARVAQRATLALVLVVTLLGGTVVLTRSLGERARIAELSPAPEGAPNVVLLILDTVRAASLSAFGYERETTPLLQAWAARGVAFDWAIAPSPWTLPSHASIFTGRYPHELSADWLSPLDERPPTIAEAFRDAGYLTAGFTANFYYTTRETGLSRGFDHFEGRVVSLRQIVLGSTLGQAAAEWRWGYSVEERLSDRRNASEINRSILDWLDARAERRPFFIFGNYFDAHRPIHAPAAFRSRFEGRSEHDEYDASIAYLDTQVDALLRALEARQLLENTIVVITSDHGELLGEHGLHGHGNSLYMPLLHVPLVFLGPEVPSGRRIGTTVGLHEMAATLTDMAGLAADTTFPGESLARFWDAGARRGTPRPVIASVTPPINAPARQPASKGPMYSLIREGLQYIRDGRGREELYDLTRDPMGNADLAAGARSRPDRLTTLRGVLDRALGGAIATTVPRPGTL